MTHPGIAPALASRDCPICAASDESILFAESNVDAQKLDAFAFASRKSPEYMHWRLLECRRCDLLYASPAPVPQALSAAYEEAAFDSALEASHAARTYARLLTRVAARLPKLDGALDIGTGDGAFLEELIDAGFTAVAGVEPSSAPIAAASPRVKPLIKQTIFRASDFSPESLHLVTCFQTIEHLHDPLAMASQVFEILKPGGAVLFVGHNRRAVSARLLGERSPIFDVEHLQLFSPVSLRRLLSEAGFADIEVRTLVNRYPVSYWARLLPIPAPMKTGMIGLMNRIGMARTTLMLPAGNLYGIGFKPAS